MYPNSLTLTARSMSARLIDWLIDWASAKYHRVTAGSHVVRTSSTEWQHIKRNKSSSDYFITGKAIYFEITDYSLQDNMTEYRYVVYAYRMGEVIRVYYKPALY